MERFRSVLESACHSASPVSLRPYRRSTVVLPTSSSAVGNKCADDAKVGTSLKSSPTSVSPRIGTPFGENAGHDNCNTL